MESKLSKYVKESVAQQKVNYPWVVVGSNNNVIIDSLLLCAKSKSQQPFLDISKQWIFTLPSLAFFYTVYYDPPICSAGGLYMPKTPGAQSCCY